MKCLRTGLGITDRFGLLLNFGQEMQEKKREKMGVNEQQRQSRGAQGLDRRWHVRSGCRLAVAKKKTKND